MLSGKPFGPPSEAFCETSFLKTMAESETIPLVSDNEGSRVLAGPDTNRLSCWLNGLKEAAMRLKRETLALYLAWSDERTPWYAKFVAMFVLGYALSPIDLIPDFIPILGLLDDLVLIPLGIWLLCRLVPDDVMADARNQASIMQQRGERAPANWCAAVIIVAIWLVGLFWVFIILRKLLVHPSLYGRPLPNSI